MKKLIVILALVALGAIAFVSYPKQGICQSCPTYTCYGKYNCGYGCECINISGRGYCVGLGRK